MLGLIFAAAVIAAPDFGEAPSQEVIEKAVHYWGDHSLKDPESARYTIRDAHRATCWYFSGRLYGYGFEFTINAKNGYGGYTGSEPYYMTVMRPKAGGNPVVDVSSGTFGQTSFCKYVPDP